ncbi:MAG: tRNA (adenosine(37)-N6)-dimethylallyltransferase MiaA [Thermodesulfobacteriota bacterium]
MPNNSHIPKIIAVLGPTAVGKSKFAIELAKEIDAQIISADSMQIYKHFDIGTSKPLKNERKAVQHHLIDIKDPDQDFNAGLYRKAAFPIIKSLNKKNKKIIIVGGTFLYVKVLLSGLIEDVPVDRELRKNLEKINKEKGTLFLHNKLKEIDNDSAEKININDFVRIQRALEVYYLTGTKISELQKNHGFNKKEFNVLKVSINTDKDNLNNIINERVDTMINNGLIDEVKKVRSLGYDREIKPMRSIGYKEINQYLDKEINLENAIDLIKRDTRRFAKRQLTWLRGDDDLNWYDLKTQMDKLKKDCLEFYGL